MKDVAAVIPTLNEAECIGTVVRELLSLGVGTVIVADGGSKDGTRAIALEAGARVVDAGKGYGRACLAGALAADAEFIVFMDGDGADDPSALPLLLTPVRSRSVDFAIGSRWRGRREKEACRFIRSWRASEPVSPSVCFMASPTPTCAPSGSFAGTPCLASA